MHVHRAVKEAGDTEICITIHLVKPRYDKGRMLFRPLAPWCLPTRPRTSQPVCRELEHRYFAEAVCVFVREVQNPWNLRRNIFLTAWER